MKLVLRNCLSSSFDEARREKDRRIKRYKEYKEHDLNIGLY